MKEQLKIYEEKMDKTIDSLMNDYASIRAGRAIRTFWIRSK